MNSILVSPLQVRCQRRRQYRPHQVSPLRRGKEENNYLYFKLFFS